MHNHLNVIFQVYLAYPSAYDFLHVRSPSLHPKTSVIVLKVSSRNNEYKNNNYQCLNSQKILSILIYQNVTSQLQMTSHLSPIFHQLLHVTCDNEEYMRYSTVFWVLQLSSQQQLCCPQNKQCFTTIYFISAPSIRTCRAEIK